MAPQLTKSLTFAVLPMIVIAIAFYIALPDRSESRDGEDFLKSIVMLTASAEESSKACNCNIEVIHGLIVSLTYPFKTRDSEDFHKLDDAGACGILVTKYTPPFRTRRWYVEGIAFKSDQCDELKKWNSLFTNRF